MGDERAKTKSAAEDDTPDVEAHKARSANEPAPADKGDGDDDDKPDVEAHVHRRA